MDGHGGKGTSNKSQISAKLFLRHFFKDLGSHARRKMNKSPCLEISREIVKEVKKLKKVRNFFLKSQDIAKQEIVKKVKKLKKRPGN